MLIQHNPNEGLKHIFGHCCVQHGNSGAHSAQPERGIETNHIYNLRPACAWVLIQHNPNEGLKPAPRCTRLPPGHGAHSAQPERGIETINTSTGGLVLFSAHSAQPERGIETTVVTVGSASPVLVLIQHNPNEGLKQAAVRVL